MQEAQVRVLVGDRAIHRVARLRDEVLLHDDPACVAEGAQLGDHPFDAGVALAEPAEDLGGLVEVQRGVRLAEPA